MQMLSHLPVPLLQMKNAIAYKNGDAFCYMLKVGGRWVGGELQTELYFSVTHNGN